QTLVDEYISSNSASIEMFLAGLRDVATEIKNSGTGELYDKAANIIYPLDLGTAPNDKGAFASQMTTAFCSGPTPGPISVAARFSAFLQQKEKLCDNAKPLALLMKEYIDEQMTDNPDFGTYHNDIWYDGPPTQLGGASDPENGARAVMTAYRPGPSKGADTNGKIENPLTGAPPYDNLRNYYSTK